MIKILVDRYNKRGQTYSCVHCDSQLFVPDNDIQVRSNTEEYMGELHCFKEEYYICPCCGRENRLSLKFY